MFNMRKFCALFFTLLMWVNLAGAAQTINVSNVTELFNAVGNYHYTWSDNANGYVVSSDHKEPTVSDGDTVILTGSTYTLTKPLYITKSITLKSEVGSVLDGNNAVQVLRIGDNNNQVKVTLDGLKITKGKPVNYTDSKADNGPVSSSGAGGGVYIGPGSEVTIANCEITGNTTSYNFTVNEKNYSQGWGGGIYVDGAHTEGTWDDQNNTYTVTKTTPAKLTLSNSKITGNTAYTSGGGIQIQSGSEATITNCEITGNTVTNSEMGGGGIFLINADVTITNCSVSNNTTAGLGGGIFYYGDKPMEIEQCTLANNKATGNAGGVGGAIFAMNFVANTAAIEITNSTITDNTADVRSGAIHAYATALTLTNCSIVNNHILAKNDKPAELRVNSGSATLTNSLIWNTDQANTVNDEGATSITLKNCALPKNISFTLTGNSLTSNDNVFISAWAELVSYNEEINGIKHTVYRIEDNEALSGLFEKGTVTGLTDDQKTAIAKDQLGNTRNSTPSIGAVEGAKPVITSTADSLTITATEGTAITDLVLEADALTWEITPKLPSGLSDTAAEDGKSYTISGTPSTAQSATNYTVTATNGVGTSEAVTVTIKVNAATPVIATANKTVTETITEGDSVNITITATAGHDLAWTGNSLPSTLTLTQASDTKSCTITGTPAVGTYSFTVTATNTTGQ
ncbi:MAG: right-handed parallel beta-helix repeat-containing protein, partial [Synergistaceae bacterium]|nr:right-handed parallel beta-helix repeat-containing protein [Synergistaceae bacterium]